MINNPRGKLNLFSVVMQIMLKSFLLFQIHKYITNQFLREIC